MKRIDYSAKFPPLEIPETGSVVVKTQRVVTHFNEIGPDYTDGETRIAFFKDGVQIAGSGDEDEVKPAEGSSDDLCCRDEIAKLRRENESLQRCIVAQHKTSNVLVKTIKEQDEKIEAMECESARIQEALRNALNKVDELESWKVGYLASTPPMQEIGREIGLNIGDSINDKILPWIRAQKQLVEDLSSNVRAWQQKWLESDRLPKSAKATAAEGAHLRGRTDHG